MRWVLSTKLLSLTFLRRGLKVLFAALAIGPMSVTADPARVEDHRPVLLGSEFYTEGWDQYFYFEDGTFLAVQFLISNFGPTDHRALVIGTLLPADGGETLVIKNGRGRKDWSFDEHNLDLRVARHRFSGGHPNYKLYMGNSNGEIELTLEAPLQTWRLGHIPDAQSKKYHYVSFLTPRARVHGRFRRGSESRGDLEPWQRLSNGWGFSVRHVNSASLNKVARSWIRLAPLDGESTSAPIFYLVQQPDTAPSSFLAIVDDRGITQQWTGIPVTMTNPGSNREAGDRPPESIRLEKAVPGGLLEGTITITRQLQRFDPIQELKPIERLFVRLLNTPVHYRYLARYELSYPGGKGEKRLSGTALVEVMALKH